jgi:hypothetical protein
LACRIAGLPDCRIAGSPDLNPTENPSAIRKRRVEELGRETKEEFPNVIITV